MASFVLLVTTVLLVFLILISVLNFPLVPAFFGVYGTSRHNIKGKLITFLLCLFPFFTIICLFFSWRNQLSVVTALPFAYLVGLWFFRLSVMSSVEIERRFSSQEENRQEQMTEMEYKWLSWEELSCEDSALFLEIWFPNPKEMKNFLELFFEKNSSGRKVSEASQSGSALLLTVSVNVSSVDKDTIISKINEFLNFAWQCDGEIYSTEIERLN